MLAELEEVLSDRVTTNATERTTYGTDESSLEPVAPDAVAFVESTDEVRRVVQICARHRVPVIAFGAGTSLEGHVHAGHGGVTLVMTGMNEILEVNVDDLDVTVQAGVTRTQLNERLRDHGLFFPIDPGADATLAGMAATRASGTTAVRYGTMRDNVLAMTVVLADGRVIRTGSRARKSSAGYDLTRLMVGSEGTLGIITEVTLRLQGIPPAISSATCTFPTVDDAVSAVIATIQFGIPVARVELLDELALEAVNAFSGLDCALAPTLFLEFHGSEEGVVEQAREVQQIALDAGGADFEWATRTEDRNRLWQARHDAYYAALAMRPGSRGLTTDVCVPISRLGACISETKRDLATSSIPAPLVGHVGDGNFHLVLLVDPGEQARRVITRMLEGDGYRVRPVPTGEDAVEALRAHGADLLVTELSLPGMSGWRLVEQLRAEVPHLRALVFSSTESAVGIDGVQTLVKPFSHDRLLRTLEELRRPTD